MIGACGVHDLGGDRCRQFRGRGASGRVRCHHHTTRCAAHWSREGGRRRREIHHTMLIGLVRHSGLHSSYDAKPARERGKNIPCAQTHWSEAVRETPLPRARWFRQPHRHALPEERRATASDPCSPATILGWDRRLEQQWFPRAQRIAPVVRVAFVTLQEINAEKDRR